MGYERYPRGEGSNRWETQDYGRDFGSGRDYTYSSARDYEAAGAFDRDRDRSWRDAERDYGSYGQRDYGDQGYGRREQFRGGGSTPQYGSRQGRFQEDDYRGSYASDGHRFENVGRERHHDDDDRGRDHRYENRGYGTNRLTGETGRQPRYGRQPQGYDYQDRGFFARAGDEVRSWFGDEDAEHRREADMRYDERSYNERGSTDRDSDYGSWRRTQIAALDRDYDEYRREHRSKFENEFSSWRTSRQTQRDSLNKVEEHMDVVGSDGTHVGTVDKVRGDRILLTKNDAEAGGRHHSIPSSWLATVDTKVTLTKSADEAKRHWRDEEQNQAMFGDKDADSGNRGENNRDSQGRMLNRSFSGTY